MYRAQIQLLAKCILLGVTLVLIEVALRLGNYPHLLCPYISRTNEIALGKFDPYAGWGWQQSRSYVAQKSAYHFDRYGFRSPTFNQGIDFSKPRILFIGDSVSFGYALNYQQTYAAKIGQLLDDNYSIVNASVEGYGSDQAYIRLLEVIEYVRPTAVVATFIADHTDRHLIRDRRQVLRCFDFPIYKPVFALVDGQLVLKDSAKVINQQTELRSMMAVTDLYDRVRRWYARETGYDVLLSQAIMRSIASVQLDGHLVPTYFIYYDANYSETKNFNDFLVRDIFYAQGLRVLPFYNWAADSDQPKYFSEPDDFFHPGDVLTSQMAEEFVAKFGPEINGLLAQPENN